LIPFINNPVQKAVFTDITLKPLLKIYTNDLWLYENAGTNFTNHTPFKHHETEFSLQPAEAIKFCEK